LRCTLATDMTKKLKEMCLRLLRNPADKEALEHLVKLIDLENPGLADHLTNFRSTGQTYPFGLVWSESMVKVQGVQYIMVRIVPKALAVLFACVCARRVLPFFEEQYPSEKRPREMIGLIEEWTDHKTTKKAIKEKLAEVQDYARGIDRQWHVAYGEGQFDTLPRKELDLSQRPLFALEVILRVAGTVGLSRSSTAWLSCVDETASLCVEAESIGADKNTQERATVWQRCRLAELIEAHC
jgi:hypothetical protein